MVMKVNEVNEKSRKNYISSWIENNTRVSFKVMGSDISVFVHDLLTGVFIIHDDEKIYIVSFCI